MTGAEDPRATAGVGIEAATADALRAALVSRVAIAIEDGPDHRTRLVVTFEGNPEGEAARRTLEAFLASEAGAAESDARRRLDHAIAQLRHLHAHLTNGTFSDARELARGLLSPQIAFLERMSEGRLGADTAPARDNAPETAR